MPKRRSGLRRSYSSAAYCPSTSGAALIRGVGIVNVGVPTAVPDARTPRRWKLALAVLGGYLLATAVYSSALWQDPLHSTLGGGSGDAALFLWFLANTSAALWHQHGHGLFVTHALNAPDGVNVLWNTGLLLPGTVLSPVTELAGPVLTLNLLLLLGPALSAWSAYLCSGRFLTTTRARVLTGLVFGFSPALMSAELGHLQLTLLFLVPPLLLTTVDAVTGRRRPVRSGLLLGVLAAAQVLIGEEVLALTGIAAVVVLVTLGVQYRSRLRPHLAPLLATTGVAAAVAVLLVGYPLAVQFFGPQSVHGEIQTPDVYVLDPVGLVVPNSVPALRHLPLLSQVPVLHTNNAEDMGYLGLPLLVLLGAVLWVRRHDVVARTAGVTAGVLGILALGLTLHLAGGAKHVPLPWGLSAGAPVVSSLLPVRWMLLVDLLVALLLGIWLDRLPTSGRRRTVGLVAVVLALVPVVPHQLGNIGPLRTPSFFTAGAGGLRGTVVLVPPPTVGNPRPMAWQAQAGLRFAMPGGYFVGPGRGGQAHFGTYPHRPTERLLMQLVLRGLPVTITPELRRHARDDLAYWHAGTVVLGPTRYEQTCLSFLTALLRRDPERTGGVWLWRDPSGV